MEIFGTFSESVGVENIREYEENILKSHQQLVAKRAAVVEQSASLSAQYAYEVKRDFKGALERFQAQLVAARAEEAAMDAEEGRLLLEEEKLIDAVREAKARTAAAQEVRSAAAGVVKKKQVERAAVTASRAAYEKKMSGEAILIERQRAHLHEVLQRAQVDEVALPTISIEEEEEEAAGATKRSGRGGSSSSSSSGGGGGGGGGDREKKNSEANDDDLVWTGSQTDHGSSLSGSVRRKNRKSRDDDSDASESTDARSASRSLVSLVSDSTHFSQQENTTVSRDRRNANKVDLSSMQRHRNMTAKQMTDAEAGLLKSIHALALELESVQPNMHASERYDGVVEKLRECEKELETTREAAGVIGGRFDEVKQERQQLFKECFQHVSESLGVIYRDLTRSSKHPLGGNAYLTLDNTDEPYLGGIRFTAMPPMKRFR
jgi:structural maintenance of chromosome 1